MSSQHIKHYISLTHLLLVLLLLFAFFIRFYRIEEIPTGLYPDEAANGVDTLHAITTGDFKLFYPANYGREGLFINIQAIFVALIGNTVTGLKIASALFGTFSVLGIYLLGSELFRRRIFGLIAAFMLATSYWAINFSRIGFRAIMTTFILTYSFYFFFRGFRTRKLSDFLLSGIIFGLGLHTYIAFRVAPLILIVIFPALLLSYEKFLKRYWKNALAFLFGATLAAAPMFSDFFILHPEDFESRSSHISIFSPEVNHGNLLGTLGKTFALSLLKYNFWGDQNWRHNYPPYPILDPFVGMLFLAGFFYVIWQTVTLLGRRIRDGDRDLRLVTNFFLLGSFFVMLMPEFLTDEGLPHALRSIGTQMPVFLMASIPAFWIIKKAEHALPGSRVAFYSCIVLLLVASAAINITKYFVYFAESPYASSSFNENYRNMVKYLFSLPNTVHKYIVIDEHGHNNFNNLPVSSHPVYFLTYDRLPNMEIVSDSTVLRGEGVFLMLNYNDDLANYVMRTYPRARVTHVDLTPERGGAFDVLILPEGSQPALYHY